MNIDGHDIRTDSIDGVTEIDVTLGGVSEGTDKMARGKFDILVRGQRVTIYRAKRCSSEKAAGQAAVKVVREDLEAIRKPIVDAVFA